MNNRKDLKIIIFYPSYQVTLSFNSQYRSKIFIKARFNNSHRFFLSATELNILSLIIIHSATEYLLLIKKNVYHSNITYTSPCKGYRKAKNMPRYYTVEQGKNTDGRRSNKKATLNCLCILFHLKALLLNRAVGCFSILMKNTSMLSLVLFLFFAHGLCDL